MFAVAVYVFMLYVLFLHLPLSVYPSLCSLCSSLCYYTNYYSPFSQLSIQMKATNQVDFDIYLPKILYLFLSVQGLNGKVKWIQINCG